MTDGETKRRLDTARDILVGKVPDPKSQVEQITVALIYKFMDDMDKSSADMGGQKSFFVGEYEQYAWPHLFAARLGGHDTLTLYRDALARLGQNPHLPQLFRDIFKNAHLPYRDPETLRLFLKTLNEFSYNDERLGDAFEYLLSILGSQGDAGQFRTPRHIIDFMVEAIAPQKNETILDPACGTAGFLISAYKYIIARNTAKAAGDLLSAAEWKTLLDNIRGYDISPDMVRLSLVNLYLHGFAQPHIFEYDTLTSEERWNEYADAILANPPFMSPKGGIKPHDRFGVRNTRSEVLFVDYIAEHLTPRGRAAVIVPEGIIFQSAGAYKTLRKMLTENYLYAVASLPTGVFNPYSGVKTSILFLDRTLAKKRDTVLFLKIEHDGFTLGAQRRETDKNDLPEALALLKAYRQGAAVPNDAKCGALSVLKAKIAESGEYNLTRERYRTVARKGKRKWDMVRLGEKTVIRKGSPITKNDIIEGDIPVIAGGQSAAYYHNEANRNGKTITVSSSGAYAGFINYFTTPIFASDCTTIQSANEDELNTDFLYYILKEKQQSFYDFQQGMGQPHVYAKDFQNFEIPLPPLGVQQEIVAEIEAERKAVERCRELIKTYTNKIGAVIGKIWGE